MRVLAPDHVQMDRLRGVVEARGEVPTGEVGGQEHRRGAEDAELARLARVRSEATIRASASSNSRIAAPTPSQLR